MQRKGPVVCWVVDDTGFPKKGSHSVGVTRQYCGQVGKQENCRVAVSLSVATWSNSLPIAWRLYLPEIWASDPQKREKAGIPEQIQFETKPMIALEQIRQAVADGVAPGVVVADAGYGVDGRFRKGVTELQLEYVVGVQSSASVWEPGKQPLPAKPYSGTGRPPRLLRRDKDHKPVSVKQLALMLPAQQWKTVNWRQGTKHNLRSRFAAVRIRPAHRDDWQAEPHPEEWLLIEWPKGEAEPAKYWLFHSAGGYQTEGTGCPRQTALDHRTELRGTQAGTRTGALRGPRLARVPPPRHALHSSLRLPCSREKPFFPLGTRRQSRIIRARSPTRFPPARIKSDPSGIILSLSRRFAYN